MINVGILLPIESSRGIDCSRPDLGNPGIGGTPYEFLLLMHYLRLCFPKKYNIRAFCNADVALPFGIVPERFETFKHLCMVCVRENMVLIARTSHDQKFYDVISGFCDLKVVVWSHNYFNSRVARLISDCEQIKANVFVGNQQRDFYIDHDIVEKSTCIPNMVPDPIGECLRNGGTPNVVFVGNLSVDKGLLEMLRIWRLVLNECPTAKLSIVGGVLDGGGDELGQLMEGAVQRDVDKILDETKIRGSVEFLGVLGKEKYTHFLSSSVGVVNPSAKTETFGMSIIEMGTAKLPVVTKGWNGHFDTVLNGKTGFLAFTKKGIATKICRLIKNENENARFGENAKEFSKFFSPETVIWNWDDLLNSVIIGRAFSKTVRIASPFWNNYKILRFVNHLFRVRLNLRALPSVVDVETKVNDAVKFVRRFRRC